MEKITITLTKEEWFDLIEVLKRNLQWRLTEENNTDELIKLQEKLIEEWFDLIEVLKRNLQWRLTEENNTDELIKLQEKLIGCMTKEQQNETHIKP